MEKNNELTIFEMIDRLANNRGKCKSQIKDLLDEVMSNQSYSGLHKPIRSRDPFIYNPEGPIIAPPTSKSPAKYLGASTGPDVLSASNGLTDYIDQLSSSTQEETIPTTEYDFLNFKPVGAYILGIEDCRDLLLRGVRAFFGGRYSAATNFNREQAAKALHALVEDYVTRRECWHEDYTTGSELLLCGTVRYDYLMSNVIPPRIWHLPGVGRLDFTDAIAGFQMEVTEVLRSKMFDKVSQVIPGATYDIYRTTRLPGGVLLEKGPDFRVVDWTRRMGCGEWR